MNIQEWAVFDEKHARAKQLWQRLNAVVDASYDLKHSHDTGAAIHKAIC